MTTDIKAIRAAAEAATPGPWAVHPKTSYAVHSPEYQCWVPADKADAVHIATANPNTVLALCDEIERLQKDAARYHFLRKNSYIELFCDSPRIEGWVPEMLDEAIDKAMESKT